MAEYGVIGGTLWGNRGAEAMVSTTIGILREMDPDGSFTVFSYMPEQDRRLVDDPDVKVVGAAPADVVVHFVVAVLTWLIARVGIRFPMALTPKGVRALLGCRALFDVSGISFYDGRLPVSFYNALCSLPAVIMGVPVVRLSQAMGPFRNPVNRWIARFVLERTLHTFARGEITAGHLTGLGLPEGSWSVAADIAFSYQPDYALSNENEARVATAENRLAAESGAGSVVAVVPSAVVFQRSEGHEIGYLETIDALIGHLVAKGHHVAVLPNATREGMDTLRNNDLPVIRMLSERSVANDAVTFVDFDINTSGVRRLMAHCSLVVTSRFHAMVASLALGLPTVVIGWSHKYEEVMAMFGLSKNAVDYLAGAEDLVSLIDSALESQTQNAATIARALPEVKRSSRGQFEVLERLP